jgi:hypothetical protein
MNSRLNRVVRASALATLPLAACAAGCLALIETMPSAIAAPEPSPVPKRWQLDVKASPIRLVYVKASDGQPKPYFYMTYTVTNTTSADIETFAPSFDLATDGGQVVRSGRDVPFNVTQEISQQLANPLLEDQIGIVGRLLRGEENAKDGLVIWAAPTLHLSELTVYAAGFSGETATEDVPNPQTNKIERKVLRKTLSMKYRVEGDLTAHAPTPLEPFETRWIMR